MPFSWYVTLSTDYNIDEHLENTGMGSGIIKRKIYQHDDHHYSISLSTTKHQKSGTCPWLTKITASRLFCQLAIMETVLLLMMWVQGPWILWTRENLKRT